MQEDDEATVIPNLSEGASGVKVESGSETNLSGNVSPSGLIGGRTLTEKEAELNPFREMLFLLLTFLLTVN